MQVNFTAPKSDWNDATQALFERLKAAEEAYERHCDDTDWTERYNSSGLFDVRTTDTDAWYSRACDDDDLKPLIEAAETLGLDKDAIINALDDAAEMQETHGLGCVPCSIDSMLGVSDETELDAVDAELNAELLKLSHEQLEVALKHTHGFISVYYWGPEKRPQISCTWEDDYTGIAYVVDEDQFKAALQRAIGDLV